jgi:hypothetical protein
MPRFFAFQVHCCKIFVFGARTALAKKLVATRYKELGLIKMVEHISAPFRYATRLNPLH